ncbi:MAG: hypothetical protein RL527_706 [Planctomycetota bacterium]|jgi:uncharacterized surface protein with fasciclin (FAS1) repeats
MQRLGRPIMADARRNWREALRHAFAVEPPGPATLNDAEAAVVARIADEVVRRGMTAPALLALESFRPLNAIGANAMHALTPFVQVVADPKAFSTLAELLERRGSVEAICLAIEDRARRGNPPQSDG